MGDGIGDRRESARCGVAGIALGALLAGCTLNPYHVPPDLVIDPAKTPRQKLDDEAASRARIGARPSGSVRGRDKGRFADGPPDASAETETSRAAAPAHELAFVDKFYESYRLSYAEAGDGPRARMMTRYGMTLIDTRCDLFFEQIGRGAQKGDFVRREFQSITAALIAVLGLANVGKDAVTAVGIGGAFGTQTIDNYSTVYFFSPDVGAVQQLVHRAFATLRTSLLSPEQSPRDFDGAVAALRTYQNVCTAHEIKRLVTAAIDSGQTIARFGGDDGPRYAAASQIALNEMAEALGVETLAPRDAAVLQLLFAKTPRPLDEAKAEVDYACSILSSDVRAKACNRAKETIGQQPDVEVYSPEAAITAGAAGEKLRAGWATLRALGDTGYNTEVDRQMAVIEQRAKEYRTAHVERARFHAEVTSANDRATKAEAELKLKAAEQKIDRSTAVSEIVSEQAVQVAPVTGVSVVAPAPRP